MRHLLKRVLDLLRKPFRQKAKRKHVPPIPAPPVPWAETRPERPPQPPPEPRAEVPTEPDRSEKAVPRDSHPLQVPAQGPPAPVIPAPVETEKEATAEEMSTEAEPVPVTQPAVESAPRRAPRPRRTLVFNLGIDFGTRFCKVCYRDIGREQSGVVMFGADGGEWEWALIPAVVWLDARGQVSLAAAEAGASTGEARRVDYLKMRLAALDEQQPDDFAWLAPVPRLDSPLVIEAVCAFLLGGIVRRAQAWVMRAKAQRMEGYDVRWTGNVCVPVQYCDSPALQRFERVFRAGWVMADDESFPATIPLDALQQWYEATCEEIHEQAKVIHCHSHPEIAAAVRSFVSSRQARDGVYIFMDVGSGTLDGVSFRFRRDQGTTHLNFYEGLVRSLGVNALCEKIMRRQGDGRAVEREILERNLLDPDDDPPEIKILKSEIHEIQTFCATLIMQIKYKDTLVWAPDFFDKLTDIFQKNLPRAGRQASLPIFFGGGGYQSHFYVNTVRKTHRARNHHRCDVPPYALVALPCPREDELDRHGLPAEEFHRFAVAYGLSFDHANCAEVTLPSQMDVADRQINTRRQKVFNYEDSKDILD